MKETEDIKNKIDDLRKNIYNLEDRLHKAKKEEEIVNAKSFVGKYIKREVKNANGGVSYNNYYHIVSFFEETLKKDGSVKQNSGLNVNYFYANFEGEDGNIIRKFITKNSWVSCNCFKDNEIEITKEEYDSEYDKFLEL